MRFGRACGLALAAGLSFGTARAFARPIAEAIRVEGDVGCLEPGALGKQIGFWLGKDDIDPRITIPIRGASDAPGPTAAIAFDIERDERLVSQRRFQPPAGVACGDLRAAVALAIALALDATLLERLGLERPADRPPPPAPAAPRAPLALLIGANALTGVLPGTVLGAATAIEAGVSPFASIRVGVLATLERDASIGPGGAVASLLAARADGCLTHPGGRTALAACVGAAAGRVYAHGRTFSMPMHTAIDWTALVTRLEARRWVTKRVALLAGADLFVPLLRTHLDVEGADGQVAYSRTFSAIGAAGTLAMVVTFR